MSGLAIISLTLLAAAAALLARGLRADPSNGRRRCPRCWYDMSGTHGLTCPECGHTPAAESGLYTTRRRLGSAKLGALLALLAITGLYAAAIGWPQLVPAPILRAAMPYLDPHAEAEIAASGIPLAALAAPRSARTPLERLKLAYRASLILDGKAVPPAAPGNDTMVFWIFMPIGSEGRIAKPSLERVFRNPERHPKDRAAAFNVLAAMLPADSERTFIADTLLNDRDAPVRAAALRNIKRPNPTDTSVIPLMTAALADPDPLIRREAAEGLGWFDGDAAESLAKLHLLAASDPDETVRDHAALAVLRIAGARGRRPQRRQ